MANETLAQLAGCLDALGFRYDLDEEDGRIRSSFQGENSPYWVSIRAAEWPGARLLRFRAYVSLREHDIPVMALVPARIEEANRFINYVNGRWIDGGHLFLDPNDGDLTLDWVVPCTSEMTPEYAGFLLRFLGQVQHFLPEVWTILTGNMTTLEAINAHRERDEASRKADEKAGGGDGVPDDVTGADDEPSDESFPFPF